MQDLLSEGTKPSEETLSYIHANKTAAMIQASLLLGLKIGSKGDDAAKVELMSQAGESLGLAFRAVDDLLDAMRSSQELGKGRQTRSSSRQGHLGHPRGIEEARKLASGHTDRAARFVEEIGGQNTFARAAFTHAYPPHVMNDERRLFSRDWRARLSFSRESGKGFAAPGGEFTRALYEWVLTDKENAPGPCCAGSGLSNWVRE